jgi:hypothetical protein
MAGEGRQGRGEVPARLDALAALMTTNSTSIRIDASKRTPPALPPWPRVGNDQANTDQKQ